MLGLAHYDEVRSGQDETVTGREPDDLLVDDGLAGAVDLTSVHEPEAGLVTVGADDDDALRSTAGEDGRRDQEQRSGTHAVPAVDVVDERRRQRSGRCHRT